MDTFISVVIPIHNGGKTITKCLDAVMRSRFQGFEVIVVDDASTDNSAELVSRFPCRLIRLGQHAGAARARNTGAAAGRGEVIFFLDADCIVAEDTLLRVQRATAGRSDTIVGGSYTPLPHDDNFFSSFQSIFIHYSELKKKEPDYLAAHAMALGRESFEKSGGFPEVFLPIIEDVEFSHRLRRAGYQLRMDPEILVRHIFGFTFWKSLRNAFRKSHYWVMYSLGNRDLFRDSGTASKELKVNVLSYLLMLTLLLLSWSFSNRTLLLFMPLLLFLNLSVNRNLLGAFFRTKGLWFGMAASLYYLMIYPLPVAAGALTGIVHYVRDAGKAGKKA